MTCIGGQVLVEGGVAFGKAFDAPWKRNRTVPQAPNDIKDRPDFINGRQCGVSLGVDQWVEVLTLRQSLSQMRAAALAKKDAR